MVARRDLTDLIQVSRLYGADPRYVLAGGGNTSVKENDDLYVKASGHALGTIGDNGFVRMSLERLDAIWNQTYPEDKKMREQQVLADLMAARCAGENARPSVEALLHAMIPFKFVVHLHPAMVNGITCAQSGQEAVKQLFPDSLWIPLVNPGYILAKTVRDAFTNFEQERGFKPTSIFLQNHGVFVGAESIDGISEIYDGMMAKIASHLVRKPVFLEVKPDALKLATVMSALQQYYGENVTITPLLNRELEARLKDTDSFYPISSSFTPDHIVYSGYKPLWIDQEVFDHSNSVERIVGLCKAFEEANGGAAKITAVQGTAAFANSENALLLYLDTLKVAAFTESFGGPRFMDDDQIDFIRTWEVESYRAKMAT
jgi:rhamnose utilization protein RhaD (predicted bifunctional aldolase and dehydrogenase)